MTLSIIPGKTMLIIFHKNLDDIGLNYQFYQKIMERLEDGHLEPVAKKNYYPLLGILKVQLF